MTGGSRGIGRAIVERLASDLDVYFTYVHQEQAASELVAALRTAGALAVAARVDSRDAQTLSALVERVIHERGRLDLLVNNAAITRDRLLARMSDDEWSSVVDTSLNGLFGASRPAARQI